MTDSRCPRLQGLLKKGIFRRAGSWPPMESGVVTLRLIVWHAFALGHNSVFDGIKTQRYNIRVYQHNLKIWSPCRMPSNAGQISLRFDGLFLSLCIQECLKANKKRGRLKSLPHLLKASGLLHENHFANIGKVANIRSVEVDTGGHALSIPCNRYTSGIIISGEALHKLALDIINVD